MENEKQPYVNLCGAKTRGGGTCKNRGMPNGRCRLHGGKSTGAPKNNKNAVTTGEHEAIWLDTLDQDERVLFDSIRTDPLEQINEGIKFLSIRERRMMIRIQEIKKGSEESSKERKFQRVTSSTGKSSKMQEVERTEKDRAKLERILAIEDALTRVQDKKTKLLELKHKFLVDEVPDEDDGNDGFIDALRDVAGGVWDDDDESS